METCAEEGDGAQPHANLSNLQSYTPTVITVYGLPLNRHSLTHTQPSSLHTASLRTGTRSLTPTFITVYGMSYESDNSVAILSLVSRNPFWTTHNTKISSAERKAGQTKVCHFLFVCCFCLVIVSALASLSHQTFFQAQRTNV